MKKHQRKNSTSLYSVSAPLLLLLVVSLLAGVGTLTKVINRTTNHSVLAEDDERDDEDKSEDERDSEGEKDSDHDDQDINKEDDEESDNEHNDSNKAEEEDDDGEEKIELVSTVNNPDGTITRTYRITDEDEVEMVAKTFDSTGKLVKLVELNPDGTVKSDENDDEEKEIEGNDRDEDGHEVEFEYKASVDGTSPELSSLIEGELEQEIEANSELGINTNKVELEVETTSGEYEYKGTTYKDGKLFGIFDISIPVGIEIDPNTGRILSVSQTFWSKLLDALSF